VAVAYLASFPIAANVAPRDYAPLINPPLTLLRRRQPIPIAPAEPGAHVNPPHKPTSRQTLRAHRRRTTRAGGSVSRIGREGSSRHARHRRADRAHTPSAHVLQDPHIPTGRASAASANVHAAHQVRLTVSACCVATGQTSLTVKMGQALPCVGGSTDPAGAPGDPQIPDTAATVAPTVGECQERP